MRSLGPSKAGSERAAEGAAAGAKEGAAAQAAEGAAAGAKEGAAASASVDAGGALSANAAERVRPRVSDSDNGIGAVAAGAAVRSPYGLVPATLHTQM